MLRTPDIDPRIDPLRALYVLMLGNPHQIEEEEFDDFIFRKGKYNVGKWIVKELWKQLNADLDLCSKGDSFDIEMSKRIFKEYLKPSKEGRGRFAASFRVKTLTDLKYFSQEKIVYFLAWKGFVEEAIREIIKEDAAEKGITEKEAVRENFKLYWNLVHDYMRAYERQDLSSKDRKEKIKKERDEKKERINNNRSISAERKKEKIALINLRPDYINIEYLKMQKMKDGIYSSALELDNEQLIKFTNLMLCQMSMSIFLLGKLTITLNRKELKELLNYIKPEDIISISGILRKTITYWVPITDIEVGYTFRTDPRDFISGAEKLLEKSKAALPTPTTPEKPHRDSHSSVTVSSEGSRSPKDEDPSAVDETTSTHEDRKLISLKKEADRLARVAFSMEEAAPVGGEESLHNRAKAIFFMLLEKDLPVIINSESMDYTIDVMGETIYSHTGRRKIQEYGISRMLFPMSKENQSKAVKYLRSLGYDASPFTYNAPFDPNGIRVYFQKGEGRVIRVTFRGYHSLSTERINSDLESRYTAIKEAFARVREKKVTINNDERHIHSAKAIYQ